MVFTEAFVMGSWDTGLFKPLSASVQSTDSTSLVHRASGYLR